MSKLRVLDLFSGIGGFSLGLERTGGFETVAFCEIEPFPRRVLAKHWPEVPCYEDVRTLTAERLRADGICVDVICGGFPCQDISFAGAGAGIAEGTRSGLWSEIARLVGEIRPAFLLVENVSALLNRGLDRVLGELAAFGYDAEWHCIPASAVGAPHRRDRLWLVAYATRNGRGQIGRSVAGDPSQVGRRSGDRLGDASAPVAYSAGLGWGENVHLVEGTERSRPLTRQFAGRSEVGDGEWSTEPDVGRVAHGVPNRVDRLRGLGNAVVPQIPELIGHAILASLAKREAA